MKNGWQTKTLGEVCGFVRGPFGGSLKAIMDEIAALDAESAEVLGNIKALL